MLAKYQMFKQNHGLWPMNLPPRIFARNATTLPSQKEAEVRLAPRKTTTKSVETTEHVTKSQKNE
jgi:hypothetical protein